MSGRGRAVSCGLLCLLAGCAADTAPDVTEPATAAAPEVTAIEAGPVYVDEMLASAAPPLPPPAAEDLLDLRPAEVLAVLPPATLVRREEHAQVLQFVAEACVLDIYFYENVPGEGFHAAHVSARDHTGAAFEISPCLQAFLPEGRWPDGFLPR